jgi:hypothetical protein
MTFDVTAKLVNPTGEATSNTLACPFPGCEIQVFFAKETGDGDQQGTA